LQDTLHGPAKVWVTVAGAGTPVLKTSASPSASNATQKASIAA
jgi:hypothetical protein